MEKQYIKKAQSGSTDAFEKLISHYKSYVFSVCLSYMKNHHDAEDACQEVFLKLWRSIGRYRGDCLFSTYIYSIAKNTCIDLLKKRNYTEELSDLLVSGTPTPEQSVIQDEFERAFKKARDSLDTDFKIVLYLRESAGLSYREIAEALSISEGTVKSRLSRAREKLLEEIKKLY